MRIEQKSPQQEMDLARITYYRCVAGSHTLFWVCAVAYSLYKTIEWIIT